VHALGELLGAILDDLNFESEDITMAKKVFILADPFIANINTNHRQVLKTVQRHMYSLVDAHKYGFYDKASNLKKNETLIKTTHKKLFSCQEMNQLDLSN